MPGVVSQAVVQLPSGMAWDNPLGLNGIFLIHKLCSHFVFVIRSMILTLLYNLINCFFYTQSFAENGHQGVEALETVQMFFWLAQRTSSSNPVVTI